MFLIFKPTLGSGYSVINDPDGVPNRKVTEEELYEEQIAAKILKERRERRARKLRNAKKKIEQKLAEGATQSEVIEILTKEVINEEPKYPFTEDVKLQVDKILEQEEKQAVAAFEVAIQELYSLAEKLKEEQEQIAQELQNLRTKKKNRKKRIKVLMLLANLDDEE